jgi:hypothetical protein
VAAHSGAAVPAAGGQAVTAGVPTYWQPEPRCNLLGEQTHIAAGVRFRGGPVPGVGHEHAYDPKPGDLAVCHVPGMFAWPIRVGQWANGDGFADSVHAFTLLPDGMIAEAAPGGARIRPLAVCGYTNVIWSGPRFDQPAAVRVKVCETARWLVNRPGGTGYSALDYAALTGNRFHLPDWPLWPGPHGRVTLDVFIGDEHRAICSQFDDLAAMGGGWHLFSDNRLPGDVTPGDLRALFLGQPVQVRHPRKLAAA